MSAPAGVPLTAEQRASLALALELFGGAQNKRGRQIYRQGRVRSMGWEVAGQVVVAQVIGGAIYTTRLIFGAHDLETSCTCPFGEYCKHAAAIVYLLGERGTKALSVCDEAEGPDQAAAAPAAGSLVALVQEQAGNRLTPAAMKFLLKASEWWEAKRERAEAGDISQLCGRAAFWGYNNQAVRLFPEEAPPATPWEFLAYLFLAARKLNLMLPAPVAELIDPDLVISLSSEVERREEVLRWRRLLGSWAQSRLEEHSAQPQLRLRLLAKGALVEMRAPGAEDFAKAPRNAVEPLIRSLRGGRPADVSLGAALVVRALTDSYGGYARGDIEPGSRALIESLAGLIESPELFARHVAGAHGGPLEMVSAPLRWQLELPPGEDGGSYRLSLTDAQGDSIPSPLALLPGKPRWYVTEAAVYPVDYWPFSEGETRLPMMIPAAALESSEGLTALARLAVPVPSTLASRVRIIKPAVVVQGRLHRPRGATSDYLRMQARAVYPGRNKSAAQWSGESWMFAQTGDMSGLSSNEEITQMDDSPMVAAAAWLSSYPLRPTGEYSQTIWLEQRIVAKDWAGQFLAWLERRPEGCEVELDTELSSLHTGQVAGTIRLDVEESAQGIDWFDLSVALQVSDTELTPEEVNLLLKAQGRWVRIAGKGWRKLDLQIGKEQLEELAALGLTAHEFGTEKHRLHALQLGALGEKKNTLLAAERAGQVRRRLEEIKTRVTPSPPAAITADLRPYQVEGFHFLSYLTENNFGGVLADDMGLGKTLQALAWIAWLREEQKMAGPVLVVCPKSVQDNWRGESAKFFPGLKVEVWTRATAGQVGLDGAADLLVIHYAQLRIHADLLHGRKWGAVILDEAQAIKNPASQNARTACALVAPYRLALTGTPIENRLMDLWSIFAFAMPGVLGNRTSFTKHFDRKDDPLARRRLAARTRPFLLRRTKKEVARELPERIEEDLVIEFDGTQAALYQAELKRARAQLLNVKTNQQLDKLRFNILTSLLRLRQICCHPRLVGFEGGGGKRRKRKTAGTAEAPEEESSAKVSALLETLEPLIEEGQKVLVFSQFVQMLEIIEQEMAARDWKAFKLTGETEDRGPLVDAFQKHDGAAVFLISLKAGGTGLNLTAASYVVLFDPWWNPAVEAQAIDRTHRIGQKKTVFAYRLLIKGTIEEKIRRLQQHKGALAQDILGEESFAKALTLDDFRFLLGGDEEV